MAVSLPDKEKLGLLLHRSSDKAFDLLERKLKPFKLTIFQYSILCQACDPGHPVNQGTIAARSGMGEGKMSNVIKPLDKKRKLVTREENPEDARDKLVRITKKGKEVFDQATKEIIQAHAELLANFSNEEKKELHRLLWKFLGEEENKK